METSLRFSRRTFVAWVGGASAGFYLFGRLPGTSAPVALAAGPGRHARSDHGSEVRDADADPAGDAPGRHDHACRAASRPTTTRSRCGRSRSRSCRRACRRRRCGATAAKAAQSNRGLLIHHAPSLTIEATANRPVRIKWINELVDANGNFLPHLLPVDPTLHWANPPRRQPTDRDRPADVRRETPGPYTGPVPIVTHVHGAVGVGDESDGYAEAWYLPAANDIPAGYATEGTWYDFFAGKAAAAYGATWGPGFAIFQYPNDNRAATIWYHDHALGMTRLNVYAGPAGFYLVRGGPGRRRARLAHRAARRACPARRRARTTSSRPTSPTGRSRSRSRTGPSTTDGSLFYPDSRVFFDGIVRDYIPDGDVLADLEPRGLREHDHGQRQHVAVPERRAAPLPLPVPQRLPVALPDPRLRRHPRGRGVADRQRGRLPRRPGQRHRQPATGC